MTRTCKRCAAGIAHEFKHGKHGYNYHGCRCDVCVAAISEYNRKQHERHRAVINERQRAAYAQDRRNGGERWRRYQQTQLERNGGRNRERARERIAELSSHPGYRAKRRRIVKRWEESTPVTKYGPYSSYEDEVILGGNPALGTLKQRAAHLGRSVRQVHARRSKLLAGKGRNHPRDRISCVNGHEFTQENTYLTKDGRRQCRQCHRDRDRRRAA